jgi:hypothetical protein
LKSFMNPKSLNAHGHGVGSSLKGQWLCS